jgi:hypothetical protein
VWANILRDLARGTSLSALDAARGYALLAMTMHDGLLASFNGKFLYGLWRPVTAIREAERDGNPETAADPAWLARLLTRQVPLERFAEALTDQPEDIKVVLTL